MRLAGLKYHLARLRRELGQKLVLGARGYRVRGYLPNRLTTELRHEPHLAAPLARALAARPGLFVDVGVNTGQTLFKVLAAEPDRGYLGFEPQLGACFYVDQFLRDNRIATARVVCLALGDEPGLVPIFAEGQADEMASVIAQHAHGARPTDARYVPVQTGDAALAAVGADEVAILKVDVEGFEVGVFRGFRETLRRARPICFFEVLPNFTGVERTPIAAVDAERARGAATALMALFADADYQVHAIGRDGREHPIDRFELDDPAGWIGSDFVAHPRA